MSVCVCHVTSVHPVDDVRIFHRECLSLAKRRNADGSPCYEVFLVACDVDDSDRDGVHIRGIDMPLGRWQRHLFLERVFRKAEKVDAALYHLHDHELLDTGLRLKRLGKCIVFDSHEDVPMQLLSKEYLPQWSRKPISRLYALAERERLKRYDAVMTVTSTTVDCAQEQELFNLYDSLLTRQ